MFTLKNPSFQKTFDAQLFQELRQKVNETVSVLESEKKAGDHGKKQFFSHFCTLLSTLRPCCGFKYLCTLWLLCHARIFLLVIIFLNLIHDAVHQTLFKSKRVNNWYVHFLI